jgi:DNA-binding protein HU-beta
MKKSDFVAAVAHKTGMSRAKADEAVNAILDLITDTLKKGEKLTLTGFGSFEVRHRAARPGRDIRTKQKITIPASKRPVFSAGAVLKAAVSKKPAKK